MFLCYQFFTHCRCYFGSAYRSFALFNYYQRLFDNFHEVLEKFNVSLNLLLATQQLYLVFYSESFLKAKFQSNLIDKILFSTKAKPS
jgi:hypothetical protein